MASEDLHVAAGLGHIEAKPIPGRDAKHPIGHDPIWIREDAFHSDGLIVYGIDDAKFDWVRSVRYMGISHEVQPADRALKCAECHGPKGRLDWKALGYEQDPLELLLKPVSKGATSAE